MASTRARPEPPPTRCRLSNRNSNCLFRPGSSLFRHPSRVRVGVLDEVATRVIARGSHRLRVAVDGRTAAGKTSFGHELGHRLAARSGRPVLRASLDDFKKPWRDRHLYDRESGEGYYRNAFDYRAVIGLLLDPAGVDGAGVCALCSIDPLTQLDHSDVLVTAAPDAILIVDGVFALRPQLNAYWDLRVWLDVTADLSGRRGVARDQDGWAGADAEDIHRNRYLAAEAIYLREVDPLRLADVVIDNSAFDAPRVLPGA